MPYPLNNVAPSFQYTDAATLVPPRGVNKLNVIVTTAAVFIQMERLDPGVNVGAGGFLPEELLVPGIYNYTREWPIGRVRFRSAVSGQVPRIIATVDVGV